MFNRIMLLTLLMFNYHLQEYIYYTLDTLKESEEEIILSLDTNDLEVKYAIKGIEYELKESTFSVSKKLFNASSKVDLYFEGVYGSTRATLECNKKGESIIYDYQNIYYGYYLTSSSLNCKVNNNLAALISIQNYQPLITIKNPLEFKNIKLFSFLTDISTTFYGELDLFLKDGVFNYLPYNFAGYTFYLESYLYQNINYLKLKEGYSYDYLKDSMKLDPLGKETIIYLPKNFTDKSIEMVLTLDFFSIQIVFNYEVRIANSVFEDEVTYYYGNTILPYEEVLYI